MTIKKDSEGYGIVMLTFGGLTIPMKIVSIKDNELWRGGFSHPNGFLVIVRGVFKGEWIINNFDDFISGRMDPADPPEFMSESTPGEPNKTGYVTSAEANGYHLEI